MDRWQAQYTFWNQFVVPAYRETLVPDRDKLTYPYITYEAAVGGFGEPIPITAFIWDRSMSPENVDRLADLIERTIRTSLPYEYDNGRMWVYIGDTTFAQDMGDPDDDLIRRKVLNMFFEFEQQ